MQPVDRRKGETQSARELDLTPNPSLSPSFPLPRSLAPSLPPSHALSRWARRETQLAREQAESGRREADEAVARVRRENEAANAALQVKTLTNIALLLTLTHKLIHSVCRLSVVRLPSGRQSWRGRRRCCTRSCKRNTPSASLCALKYNSRQAGWRPSRTLTRRQQRKQKRSESVSVRNTPPCCRRSSTSPKPSTLYTKPSTLNPKP